MQLSALVALVQAEPTRGETGVVAQPAPVYAPAGQSGQPPPTHQQVEQAVGQIKAFLDSSSASVEFSLQEDSGRVVIRIVDEQTQELIRQIPSEEVLTIAQALGRIQGLLVSEKA